MYVSEYRKYPLAALSRARAVTMTLVPASDVHEGSFSTQLTLPAGTLDPNQQYVVATAVVNPDLGYSVEDTSYNSWVPLEVQPADTQDEPLKAQILSGQLEIPQEQNLIVYKATGLGDAQAFEIMTSIYAIDEQGNRHVLAASPARADVVNGTLLDGIEVPGARLAVLQDVHPDLRYVLNVEIAPSASRAPAVQSVEIPLLTAGTLLKLQPPSPPPFPLMSRTLYFQKPTLDVITICRVTLSLIECVMPRRVARGAGSSRFDKSSVCSCGCSPAGGRGCRPRE